jgi:hypothetical protein
MKMRLAVAFAVAGLLLAACSSNKVATTGGTSPTPATAQLLSLIKAAPTKTSSGGTATISGTTSINVTGTAETIAQSGVVDFTTKQTQYSVSVPGQGTVQLVVDNGILYMDVPSLATYTGGKPWLKIDPTELSQTNNPLASIFASLKSEMSDPSQQLDFLEGVTGTVDTVGTETIGGVSTTHYRFSSDLAAALKNLPASSQAAFQQLESSLGTSTATVNAWIDGQGLVRQVQFSLTPPSTATPGASSLASTTTLDFSRFGDPVTVTVPPASQVTDFSQMLNGLSGLGGLGASPTP